MSPKDCGEAAHSDPVFQEVCRKGAERPARAGGPRGQATRYAGVRDRKAAWVKEAQGGCTTVVPAAAIPAEGRRHSSQGGRQMAGPRLPWGEQGSARGGSAPPLQQPLSPSGSFSLEGFQRSHQLVNFPGAQRSRPPDPFPIGSWHTGGVQQASGPTAGHAGSQGPRGRSPASPPPGARALPGPQRRKAVGGGRPRELCPCAVLPGNGGNGGGGRSCARRG